MFGRAETACEAIYYCRHPTGCLPAGEKGSNLSDEENAKGSSEKACISQDEKMFSYKLADLDLTLTVGLATVN